MVLRKPASAPPARSGAAGLLAGLVALGLSGLVAGLGGCAPVAVGAAGATGVAVAQERSVGAAIDDTTIHARVNAKLFNARPGLAAQVDVEVNEGRVLLTGTVPTPEDRITATRLAWEVGGVREVINELQVSNEDSVVDYARDAWISTQLRTKLAADRQVSSLNYSIETVNGTIYLLGIAQDQAELDRVIAHARNISGVREVVSHVRLREDVPPPIPPQAAAPAPEGGP